MTRVNASIAEKIMSRVAVNEETKCWEWIGVISLDGYGYLKLNRKTYRAHRIAWAEFTGHEIPAGMHVCHKCDNRKCVNPEHLFIGTNSDNHRDKLEKGRQARGASHSHALLSEIDVIDIRKKSAHGESTRQLAREYGVCHSTIARAIKGDTWKCICE